MEKFLVSIEFRYNDAPRYADGGTHQNKEVTIGVFETFGAACAAGNKLMEEMESRFKLHRFPNGSEAAKERFSLHGGPFHSKKDLITDLAYMKTPFNFFASIKTLRFDEIDTAINDVLAAVDRHKKYKTEEEED
jgi:hypothetical protein